MELGNVVTIPQDIATDRRAHINVSIPVGDLRLRQKSIRAWKLLTIATVTVLNPPKAVLSKLVEIPLTVLGVASIDFAAFHMSSGFGWLVTGISLIMLEYMIADDEDSVT